jgi:Predicted membrane protein
LSEISIVIGYLAGGIIRGLAVATVVTFIALFFTQINIKHPFMTFFVIIMTAAVFSLAGLINAIFAKKFDDIAVIPSFVLAPLTYLGGVFYTVSLLPDFWQTLSRFNPILYMINSMRYSVIGISDVSIQNALMMIVFFFILLFTTAVILLRKGIGIRQ